MQTNEITISREEYNQQLLARIQALESKVVSLVKLFSWLETEVKSTCDDQFVLRHEFEGMRDDVRRHDYEIEKLENNWLAICN